MPPPDANRSRADVWLSKEDDEPEVLVVGVPSAEPPTPQSRADLSPMGVRDRLSRFTTFHGEKRIDFDAVRVRDVGNWAVSELDMHQMPEAVETLARDLPEVPLTLYLGGDTAITGPLVASLGDLSNVGLITFSAQIEEHSLPGANIVQVGVHSFSNLASSRAHAHEAGIGVITVSDVETEGVHQVVRRAFDRLEHCDQVFVGVDLGVLDRAFAPACRRARPGGMSLRQLAEGIFLCASNGKTRAMDFVGVDPELDVNEATIDATAHLLLTAVAGFAGR